ncbi:MAG: 30S ribosome-binding factor RbfA [Betaproteobacteria bacterium]|jgi:ribosome-binding factor A|nr:30S ribosome-binding factor RbfA [Betaproteobacteria bacterium]
MKSFPRRVRIADQIQKELSELVRRSVKDPRLGKVTLTSVEVAADYSHAKIYVSSWQSQEILDQSIRALTDAAGFLRHQLGRRLTLHTLPQLHFVVDQTLDRAVALTHLIDAAVAADEAQHQP